MARTKQQAIKRHPPTAGKAERKKHRLHPGTDCLREIRFQQKQVDSGWGAKKGAGGAGKKKRIGKIFPKKTIYALFQEVLAENGYGDFRVASDALDALECATREFGTELFQVSQCNASHRQSKTVDLRDFVYAKNILMAPEKLRCKNGVEEMLTADVKANEWVKPTAVFKSVKSEAADAEPKTP